MPRFGSLTIVGRKERISLNSVVFRRDTLTIVLMDWLP
jgi:hypothetical protein